MPVNIAVRKALADIHYLQDTTLDDDLMVRTARVVAASGLTASPHLRTQLGVLADWMRLYQQTLDQLEQEIKDAAA
jgi:hypothetical protein